ARPGVDRLGLDSGRRCPAQAVVSRSQCIAAVDVPIELGQEQPLVTSAWHLARNALEEVKRVINLGIREALTGSKGAIAVRSTRSRKRRAGREGDSCIIRLGEQAAIRTVQEVERGEGR